MTKLSYYPNWSKEARVRCEVSSPGFGSHLRSSIQPFSIYCHLRSSQLTPSCSICLYSLTLLCRNCDQFWRAHTHTKFNAPAVQTLRLPQDWRHQGSIYEESMLQYGTQSCERECHLSSCAHLRYVYYHNWRCWHVEPKKGLLQATVGEARSAFSKPQLNLE